MAAVPEWASGHSEVEALIAIGSLTTQPPSDLGDYLIIVEHKPTGGLAMASNLPGNKERIALALNWVNTTVLLQLQDAPNPMDDLNDL
jgi:hypothetical protein